MVGTTVGSIALECSVGNQSNYPIPKHMITAWSSVLFLSAFPVYHFPPQRTPAGGIRSFFLSLSLSHFRWYNLQPWGVHCEGAQVRTVGRGSWCICRLNFKL